MAVPTLTPASTTSKVILTSTGSTATTGNGSANITHYPFGIYATGGDLFDASFISGASDQVAYTYKKLGGDVLDIELTVGNVYAAYEESVLEYAYHINKHQAKNVLGSLLGFATGTFDHDGQMTGGDASGSAVNLAFPKFKIEYARKVGEGFAEEGGIGGDNTFYSASFALSSGVQDYDLQTIISKSAADNYDQAQQSGPVPYANLVGNRKVKIQKVFYKTPGAMWRFYGYYGGLNVVGNLNYYGQYSDDSTFEIIPVWQNKLQAMAYEDHIHTRLSHYSYELFNNNLRIFPIPHGFVPNMYVQFTIDSQPWTEDEDRKNGTDGINNMSTLPFDNIPYKNINAIGKHWIRRYALALCKEMLGQIRGKFGGSIPIPGDNVTLNSADLLGQAKEEQDYLKEELKTILDEMTYNALAKQDAEKIEAIDKVNGGIPLMIYQG
jgi:hypothetical protein